MINHLSGNQSRFILIRFWDTPCTFWSDVKIKDCLTITFKPQYTNFSITPRFKMFFLLRATFWAKYCRHKIINFTRLKKMLD